MRVRKNLGTAVLAALLVLTATSVAQASPTPIPAVGGTIGPGGPVAVEPGGAPVLLPADTAAKRAPSAPVVAARKHVAEYGPVTVGPNRWQEPEVYCPAGMVATGGGEYNSNAGAVTLHQSYALPGGRGWKVQITNLGTTDITVRVYAVCFSGLSGYQHVYAKRLVQQGSFGDAWAVCPPGLQAVGGGGLADTYWTRVDSNPGDDLRAWRFGIVNNDSAPKTVQAQAICANGVQHLALAKSQRYIEPPWSYYGERQAVCPNGLGIVSGGGFGGRITDSHPQGEAWRIYYHYEHPPRAEVMTFALCGQ
ncbi:hypothetical protein JOF53_003256 [Crossiella equi]|uniref:Uncharacterized protein n=1 Tax=Crossiella equi TaxID=130796 RepID=A0ABS5ADU4_9PSEU|nr:hypothetical protein [Crossiella equi]MBP2474384.1 hypothetical protein [Crossiella equi]